MADKKYLDLNGLGYVIRKMDDKKADIESPVLIGTPTAPTATEGTKTSQIASTEFVCNEIAYKIGWISVTYSEFLDLIANNNLVPNAVYRMTDFVTTCSEASSGSGKALIQCKSANHRFDLVITADSTNTFVNPVTAAVHEGDSYFKGYALTSWKVYYTTNNVNNNAIKAVSSGKGTITRLIDEYNNDLPYDFKNITWYRDSASWNNKIATNYYYAFSYGSVKDRTMTGKCYNNSFSTQANNTIFYYSNATDDSFNIKVDSGFNNNTIITQKCYTLSIGPDFQGNLISSTNFFINSWLNGFKNNTLIGTGVTGATGSYCRLNFGALCESNNISLTTCTDSTTGQRFTQNDITGDVQFCNFSHNCYGNKIEATINSCDFGFQTCNVNLKKLTSTTQYKYLNINLPVKTRGATTTKVVINDSRIAYTDKGGSSPYLTNPNPIYLKFGTNDEVVCYWQEFSEGVFSTNGIYKESATSTTETWKEITSV